MPRTKKHFKVHASIRNHRKTADFWSDPALRGMYVEIGLLAVERYADQTNDSFIVTGTDLVQITGAGNVGAARRKLEPLLNRSPITCEPEGLHWRIGMPNFRRKQGFRDRNGVKMGDSASASSSSSAEEGASPPSLTLVAGPKKRASGLPVSLEGAAKAYLDDEFMTLVASCFPPGVTKRPPGKLVTFFWLCDVIPAMKARGFKSLRKTAPRWAAKARPGDFEDLKARAGAGEFDEFRKLVTIEKEAAK